MAESDIQAIGMSLSGALCSFDNAEVYADGKAETVMGQAIKVRLPNWKTSLQCHCAEA